MLKMIKEMGLILDAMTECTDRIIHEICEKAGHDVSDLTTFQVKQLYMLSHGYLLEVDADKDNRQTRIILVDKESLELVTAGIIALELENNRLKITGGIMTDESIEEINVEAK